MVKTASLWVLTGILAGSLSACVIVTQTATKEPTKVTRVQRPKDAREANQANTTAPRETTRQAAVEEVAEPAEAPEETTKGIAEGQPPGFRDRAPEAYWVWHDRAGWHLRTTTAHQQHRFQGRIWVGKGEVGNVHPTGLELGDRLKQRGNALAFDFTTKGHADGFDFQIAEGECAKFNLLIDGKGKPDAIYVGGRGEQPRRHVFRVCK
jgi:hypothetical protein